MSIGKIMLIRHAEKPNGDGGPGLMRDGTQNPERLTATGWKRADALVGLFAPANGTAPRAPLGKPKSLFASGSESLRPMQTITPLAAALDLSITTFLKGQEAQLVAAVKAAEGPTLISWQHEAIPEIATLIRGKPDGVPPDWPGKRFDLVWVFDLNPMGRGASPKFPSWSCRTTPGSRSVSEIRPRASSRGAPCGPCSPYNLVGCRSASFGP